MTRNKNMSRRNFVSASASAAVISGLPLSKLSAKAFGASGDTPDWKNQGVENLAKSPYAKLHNIPVHAVTITSGFWATRRETNVAKSIPSMEKLLETNGRMNNFRRLTGKSTEPQHGPVYSDSDVYKWTEAVGFALQAGDRPELRATTEQVIADV